MIHLRWEDRGSGSIDYFTLSEHYRKYAVARQNYWSTLQDAANQIFGAYRNSLKLTRETYSIDGKNRSYVELGQFENNEFKRCHYVQLSGDDDFGMIFGIQTALEEGPSVHPKLLLSVPIQVMRQDDRLQVSVGIEKNVTRMVPWEGGEERFDEVAKDIQQALISALDITVFQR